MSGHRKWSEVRESRRRNESDTSQNSSQAALRKKLSDHVKSLRDLRRARRLTQQQLAKVMQVSQAQVSRVENQADLYLSTLRSYIEAMGGEMQIRVAFPGADWTEVTIGDVTDAEPGSVKPDIGAFLGSDIFVTYSHTQVEGPSDTPSVLRIWPNLERDVSAYSDFATTFNRLWASRAQLHASGSACGFIVNEPGEHLALESKVTWRTAADPFVPADSENFISSAQFKEK